MKSKSLGRDCSPPGSPVHDILQARTLEWVAIPFCRGSSRPRDWTCVSCVAGRFFTIWATGEVQLFNEVQGWAWEHLRGLAYVTFYPLEGGVDAAVQWVWLGREGPLSSLGTDSLLLGALRSPGKCRLAASVNPLTESLPGARQSSGCWGCCFSRQSILKKDYGTVNTQVPNGFHSAHSRLSTSAYFPPFSVVLK